MSRTSTTARIGPLQVAVILATVFTAAVHVYLAVTPNSPEPQLRLPFWLAAVGYLGAVTALYAPLGFLEPLRWLARLALLGVTVFTIIAYFVVVGFVFDALSLSDKLVEALLVILLVADAVSARVVRTVRTARTEDQQIGPRAAA
jgi:hypothetical protein